MTDYAELIERLKIEAGASEELNPGDSDIETMRDAAQAITTLSKRVAELEAQCALLGGGISGVCAAMDRDDLGQAWDIGVRVLSATPAKIKAAAELLAMSADWYEGQAGTAEFMDIIRRYLEASNDGG